MNFDRGKTRYVIVDEASRRFTLRGPTQDDSRITAQVAQLQAQKRRVRIMNIEDERTNAEIIAELEAVERWTYTNDPIV